MNQELYRKLKIWRQEKADKRMCELYRIMTNKTMEDIAVLVPTTRQELLRIKGIGEKKFQAYGMELLALIDQCSQGERCDDPYAAQTETKEVLTVGAYLDAVNDTLGARLVKVKGEVSSFDIKKHLYFSLKDPRDGSVMQCFMWERDYLISGVEIAEGMEVTVYGFAEIYKPNGRFTFRSSALELSGQGALKKAYEELKHKLEDEGIFDEQRKKSLPELPRRIGLITSREGAVINDFLNNIGRFGFILRFFDSRVEGMLAVKELVAAIRYFQKNSVDVLVIIRGGGSLESLQAFNNEALIREVAKLDMPVMCGIGHDKDVPLLAYVADKAYSTPSIVAKELNRSWEQALGRLEYYEKNILSSYGYTLKDIGYALGGSSGELKNFYLKLLERFAQYRKNIEKSIIMLDHRLQQTREKVDGALGALLLGFTKMSLQTARILDTYEKVLHHASPERQLKLGYSIVTHGGKVLRSVSQVNKGDRIKVRLGDGTLGSSVEEIGDN